MRSKRDPCVGRGCKRQRGPAVQVRCTEPEHCVRQSAARGARNHRRNASMLTALSPGLIHHLSAVPLSTVACATHQGLRFMCDQPAWHSLLALALALALACPTVTRPLPLWYPAPSETTAAHGLQCGKHTLRTWDAPLCHRGTGSKRVSVSGPALAGPMAFLRSTLRGATPAVP